MQSYWLAGDGFEKQMSQQSEGMFSKRLLCLVGIAFVFKTYILAILLNLNIQISHGHHFSIMNSQCHVSLAPCVLLSVCCVAIRSVLVLWWGDLHEYIPLSVLTTFFEKYINWQNRRKNYQLLLADIEKIFCQAQKKRFSHFLKDFCLPYVPT